MISFIIIGKNEGWRLEKCLSAVRRRAEAELVQPWEVIYVDSQSSDGSVELARQYADKAFLLTGECNPAIGRNVGAKESEGDILFFIDGDMELRESVLSTIVKESGDLCYPFMEGIEFDILFDSDWQQKDAHARQAFCEGAEWYDNKPSTGMFVIDKKVWEEVGGMDNRFKRSEDYDFGFRAGKMGYKTRRIGQLWVNHYTRYYALRNDPLSVYKYSAMLTRKYGTKGFAFKTLFKWNYSAYSLLFCLLFFIATLNIWIMVPYILLLGYRTMRVFKRTSVRLNWATIAYQRFAKDVLLFYYCFTYFPDQPVVSYNRIK